MRFEKSIHKYFKAVLYSLALAMIINVSVSIAADDGEGGLSGVGQIDAVSFTDGFLVIDDHHFTFASNIEYVFPSGYTYSRDHFSPGVSVSWKSTDKMELFQLEYIAAAGKSIEDTSDNTEPVDSSGSNPGNNEIRLEDGVYRN